MSVRTPSAAGFTLLEVLAAVALLGIVYTVLARVAIQGVGEEGESRRRLEASLLADQQLADIEAGLDVGVLPELGSSETDFDPYRVEIAVEPFDLDAALAGEGSASATPPSGSGDADFPMRSIRVIVSWDEGGREFQVARTTYGYDADALAGVALSRLAETP